MSVRIHPHVEVVRFSPNVSSRGGAQPTLIPIHVTAGHNRPGVVDLQGLGEWFAVGSAAAGTPVSCHVAVDNEGHSARYVRDAMKAWQVAAYNRMSVGIEQIAPGDGTEITLAMYEETGRWVARFGKLHGIPIAKAHVTESGLILRAGVIRHSELGALGGGHSDPGAYDMSRMLWHARQYRKHL
jgi:hypothetical protein